MLTDLYEFTMAEVYFRRRMFRPACFSLFIRAYPPDRGYFVSAGLENVLAFLQAARFSSEDVDYLAATGKFSRGFLDYLADFRFSGDVEAMPEGRVFFADEPVLEVTAPLIEGQLVETSVINMINLQVNLATKVSRCVHAARGRGIVDFALRRTQGADAGMALARAGYIAGLNATSNVLAGKIYGVPISGTMAHSYITSFEDETEAFRAFAEVYGDDTVLLIDTYDTLRGADKAIVVAKEMQARGQSLRGVRLDSGDMTELSRNVRARFDREGLDAVQIFASGGFDEFKIARGIRDGCAIDAYGVGTKMGVSADSPYTDIAYKLVEYDGRPLLKLSSGKKTLVGRKQVFRREENERLSDDTIALREENLDGAPLLETVMQAGRRTAAPEDLDTMRRRCAADLAKLPSGVKAIKAPKTYPVHTSERLEERHKKAKDRIVARELDES
jgi:nicotinate phosphoribosyltransferase